MVSYNFLLATIALAFLCNCQADLINDVCSKFAQAALCDKALRSDPRSEGADLKGLGEIIIKKSLAATQAATKVAKSVKTSKNREIIETCIETQNDAKDLLNECKKLLKEARSEEDKHTLNTKASAALTYVGTCDDEFEPSEPPKLKRASQNAQYLIEVLLLISKLL